MVPLEDCLALCELTEDEVVAIAEHEHLPDTVALEMGSYLVQGPGGEVRIQRIIIDDISAARQRGDLVRASEADAAAVRRETSGVQGHGLTRARTHDATFRVAETVPFDA
jgi:hypothetical protein